MSLQKACIEHKSASVGGLNIPELRNELKRQYPNRSADIDKARTRTQLESLCAELLGKPYTEKSTSTSTSYEYVYKPPQSVIPDIQGTDLNAFKQWFGLVQKVTTPDSLKPDETILYLSLSGTSRIHPSIQSLTNLEVLRLNVSDLDYIPPLNITKLYISYYGNIDMQQICALSELTLLDITSYTNKTLPNMDCVTNLKKLRNLQLSGQINDTSFIFEIPTLKVLYISNNKFVAVPDFSTLTNLTHLSLRYSNLTVFPKVPVSLERLNLSHNEISILPNIDRLKYLIYFELDNNLIKKIPDINLPQLVISLHKNPINYSSDNIRVRQLLVDDDKKHLIPPILQFKSWIYQNYFITLLESLTTNSTDIYLESSEDIIVPDSITAFTRLKLLSLTVPSEKSVKIELPESIIKLKELNSLVLSGGELILPKNFNKLQITYLNIKNKDPYAFLKHICDLPLSNLTLFQQYTLNGATVPQQLNCQLPELKDLTIRGTDTDILDMRFVCQFEKLKNLTIDGFKKLENLDCVSELKNLVELNLYQNNLTYLPNSIANLKKLEQLNVSHNKLTTIPPLKVKKIIILRNNPIESLPLLNADILLDSDKQHLATEMRNIVKTATSAYKRSMPIKIEYRGKSIKVKPYEIMDTKGFVHGLPVTTTKWQTYCRSLDKEYGYDELKDIAQSAGIDIRNKNKRQLCQELAIDFEIEQICRQYTLAEMQEIARDKGVVFSGLNKKALCAVLYETDMDDYRGLNKTVSKKVVKRVDRNCFNQPFNEDVDTYDLIPDEGLEWYEEDGKKWCFSHNELRGIAEKWDYNTRRYEKENPFTRKPIPTAVLKKVPPVSKIIDVHKETYRPDYSELQIHLDDIGVNSPYIPTHRINNMTYDEIEDFIEYLKQFNHFVPALNKSMSTYDNLNKVIWTLIRKKIDNATIGQLFIEYFEPRTA